MHKINLSNEIYNKCIKENAKEITERYLQFNSSIEHCSIDDTKQLPHLEAPEKTLEAIQLYL